MDKYKDIINLPHHQSTCRPHMSLYDRAAQFSPFAALTGYDEVVKETARLTERKHGLSEKEKATLSTKLLFLRENIKAQPEVSITYFIPDERKDGGAYLTTIGRIKRIDEIDRVITLTDRTTIPFDDIADMTGEVFDILGLDE